MGPIMIQPASVISNWRFSVVTQEDMGMVRVVSSCSLSAAFAAAVSASAFTASVSFAVSASVCAGAGASAFWHPETAKSAAAVNIPSSAFFSFIVISSPKSSYSAHRLFPWSWPPSLP